MKLLAFTNENNFGDLLSKPILDKLLNTNLELITSPIDEPHYFGIGSIAAHANKHSIIIGSGIGSITQQINQEATVLAVRGPITAIKTLKTVKLQGDPALLLSHFYQQFFNLPKKYEVSIVPHYVDYEQAKQLYPGFNIINVINKDPFKVLEQICQSKRIISSSLHGIIAAQSYNIPATYIKLGDRLFGDKSKFVDHFLSLNDNIQQDRIYSDKIKTIQQNYLKEFK